MGKTVKKELQLIGNWIVQNFFSFLFALVVLVSLIVIFGINDPYQISYLNVVEALKVSVTVLVSMLGFCVSIYVFLNNTFQSRRSANTIEKNIIEKFQQRKRIQLGRSIIFSVSAVFIECIAIMSSSQIEKRLSASPNSVQCAVSFFVVAACAIVTMINIWLLGRFTYGVINFEDGLRQLAKTERDAYKGGGDQEKIRKSDFLNMVNNIEVLAERLIRNHLHAKTSSALDSELKRAICDGETEPGEISTRTELAQDYKNVIDYRNLLLQDAELRDSDVVGMGDKVKSVLNRFFQRYLRKELLTGVSISNLTVVEADLSKASFSNSFLQNISFRGTTNLQSTDFRNSTLSNISFDAESEINCENINFADSKLIGIKFHKKMSLQRAVFTNADLKSIGTFAPEDKEGDGLQLSYAIFERANMTYLDIYNVCFDFANFNDARLVDSKIGRSAQKGNNTSFKYADMIRADMLKCVIERCNFQNANLSQAILTYTEIQDVSFSECRLRGASMAESVLHNCCFDKAYCSEMSLKGAKVTASTFNYATMTSVDMSGATFKECDFADTVCHNTLWARSSIENSSFVRCVLGASRIVGENEKKTQIRDCRFLYTDFSDAAITNIEFRNCDFLHADFTNVRLINVSFFECKNLETVLTKDVWMAEVTYGPDDLGQLTEPQGGWRNLVTNPKGDAGDKSR